MIQHIFVLICILYTTHASAEERVYKNMLNTCTPTKPTINNYEPIKFQPSNNLLHRAGAVPMYCGDKMILRGKLLDVNCVPVADAKVYLWQAGCDGKYPYKPLRKTVNQSLMNPDAHSSFQGSGIATTNNNGEFQFITIRPIAHYAINLRVDHMHLGVLQTQFIPPEDTSCGCESSDVFDFTIVMSKADLHRRY